MKYQFHIDNRPAAVAREDFIEALQDAVDAGYGAWISEDQIKIDKLRGGSIETFRDL